MKRFLPFLLILSFLLTLTMPAMAADDATGTTLRLEETNGTVTVKDAAGKNKSAREGMRLYSGYTIATGASSSAYISLDDTKAVKLDSSGKVEIKKSGKKLEVSLTSGQIYFNVTEPLKVDESLNIRTSTMVTGIRGSFGWVNLTRMGLMHGHVTLTCTNPETGETRVTEVYTGEKVSYEQAAAAGGADSELAEIDFVKEAIVLEDVPATVVEEIAKDETLRSQLAEDETVTIDVTELVESLEGKQEEEKKQEEQAQETVEAAFTAQEEAIVAAAAEDTAGTTAGGTTTNYVDLSANTTPATGGGGGGDSGGDYTPVVTSTTVSVISELQAALNNYTVVTYNGEGSIQSLDTLTVPSGKTLNIGDGKTASNIEVKTLTNNGTIIVVAKENYVNTQDACSLQIHPTESAICTNNGQITIPGNCYASIWSSDGTGSFVNAGMLTIQGGHVSHGNIRTTNSGRINNAGEFVNGTTVDFQTILTNNNEIINTGLFYNGTKDTVYRSGKPTLDNRNGTFTNSTDSGFYNYGIVNN